MSDFSSDFPSNLSPEDKLFNYRSLEELLDNLISIEEGEVLFNDTGLSLDYWLFKPISDTTSIQISSYLRYKLGNISEALELTDIIVIPEPEELRYRLQAVFSTIGGDSFNFTRYISTS